MLELCNISYQYGSKQVLEDVSFCIERGEFCVLLGANGAGKSTLFRLITRLLPLQKGEVVIDGHSLENYQKALRNIGIVFQEPTLDLDLTVRQNLHYYGALKGLSFSQSIHCIHSDLERLDLIQKLDTKVRNLNGGHKRRVELARAMIAGPTLLLLDEPSVGLDIQTRQSLLSYIKEKVQEKNLSVLWITHLFDEIQGEDKVILLDEAKLIENGTANALLSKHKQSNVADLFKHLTKKPL